MEWFAYDFVKIEIKRLKKTRVTSQHQESQHFPHWSTKATCNISSKNLQTLVRLHDYQTTASPPPQLPPASSLKLPNGDKFIVWPFLRFPFQRLVRPLIRFPFTCFSFNYFQFILRIVAFDINLDK
jgi:hypothetical protein